MKKIIPVAALLLAVTTLSQAQYGPDRDIPGMLGATTLRYPWAGGLNNPQFSNADLDHDGLQDLVVFDRTGNKLLTFRNNGGAYPNNYDYAPQYEANFPSMDAWCLLPDFNCDGVPDIFTHTTLGIQVYKGYYNGSNQLSFNLYSPLIRYQSTSGWLNLLVTNVDVPAFVDMNNDGDIDVLTFDPNGGYMWYFENTSQENGWGCDSLEYYHAEKCWGDLFEPSTTNAKLLDQPCPFVSPVLENTGSGTRGTRHTGSTTLCFDNTGDGIKEALVGDISFDELCYLRNNGTLTDSHIFAQDSVFPSYNVPAEVPTFPAAFRADVDNDGVMDLLVAPNADAGGNYSACSWLYKNTGSNSVGTFQFQTDSFLVNQMFDVGEGCTPVWFDYDNDGLVDLLLANFRYYDTCSFIATLKNVGTSTAPAFKLTKRNYAGLAVLNKQNLHPTFGDLDGDGDPDMVVGNEDGMLLYYQNNAAAGAPAQFALAQSNYFGIDVGGRSAPQLVDVNGDGLLDLVIGKASGKISYYQNGGTAASADFSTLTNSFFGNVNANPTSLDASSVPCVTHLPGHAGWVMLVGNNLGDVQLYDNIEGNLSGSFNLVTNNYSGIRAGKRSAMDARDINGDGVVELAIGNYRGGVTIYDTSSYTSVAAQAMIGQRGELKAYPNPTNNRIYLRCENGFDNGFTVTTYDVLGHVITIGFTRNDANTLVADATMLPSGVYFTRLTNGVSSASCRWMKSE